MTKHRSHDFHTRTRMENRPYYKWLSEQSRPAMVLNASLAAYYEVSPPELAQLLDGARFDQLQTIFNTFWKRKAQQMEPQFIKPGFVDVSGAPTRPAPRPTGNGYAPFVLWKRRDTDETTVTTGTVDPSQLQESNPTKYARERRLSTGDTSASWSSVPPENIEQFLQRVYEDKDLRLVRVIQSKHEGDVLPSFEFTFTNRKHVRRKKSIGPTNRRQLERASGDS